MLSVTFVYPLGSSSAHSIRYMWHTSMYRPNPWEERRKALWGHAAQKSGNKGVGMAGAQISVVHGIILCHPTLWYQWLLSSVTPRNTIIQHGFKCIGWKPEYNRSSKLFRRFTFCSKFLGILRWRALCTSGQTSSYTSKLRILDWEDCSILSDIRLLRNIWKSRAIASNSVPDLHLEGTIIIMVHVAMASHPPSVILPVFVGLAWCTQSTFYAWSSFSRVSPGGYTVLYPNTAEDLKQAIGLKEKVVVWPSFLVLVSILF